MKNCKDFFSSLIAMAMAGTLIASIALLMSLVAFVFLVLFVSASLFSTAFLTVRYVFRKTAKSLSGRLALKSMTALQMLVAKAK